MVHPKKFLKGIFIKKAQIFKNFSEMFRLTTLNFNLKSNYPIFYATSSLISIWLASIRLLISLASLKNASSTLFIDFDDISINIRPCSLANASPSSFLTFLIDSKSL